jgi:hypothetical protein
MGDNVIDDAQVIFEVESITAGAAAEGIEASDADPYQAGGDVGKVILNSVTLTIDRPTNGHSGIGNEGHIAVGYGTREATMDHEEQLNERAAEMLADLYNNDRSPRGITILAGDVLDASGSKFDWNNLEVNIEDDGGATVSISGLIRGLKMDTDVDTTA